MSDAENTPADWVLLEAARRTAWSDNGHSIERLRQECGFPRSTYRALCDMIAKHEQPPVDPDVEAVKRIMREWYGFDPKTTMKAICYDEGSYDRAVAQYKKERAK